MNDNNFENYPGSKHNQEPSEADLARADEWENAMSSNDVPEYSGEASASSDPELSEMAVAAEEGIAEETQDNGGLSNAAAIIYYGLNTAARQYGVETVIQAIKGFNNFGSENPVKDLFDQLGIDTPEEFKDNNMEAQAIGYQENEFLSSSPSSPGPKNRSKEGALKAIQDIKELISEVEGADPRYEQLRREAKAAGKGYFEYAVGSSVNRGLTDLFDALAAEPKKEKSIDQTSEEQETLNPEILEIKM